LPRKARGCGPSLPPFARDQPESGDGRTLARGPRAGRGSGGGEDAMRRRLPGLLAVLLAAGCSRSPEKTASSPAPAAKTTAAPPAKTSAAPPRVEADDGTRAKRPAGGRSPVIWLALDGLDWELLDRLVAEGKMPNWKRLTEEGYSAWLKSYVPTLSPVVWTTLATGVG